MTDFETTAQSKERIAPALELLLEEAAAIADDFYQAGQDTGSSCHLAANMFMVTAWRIAQIGAIADERNPDPDKFRKAVEFILDNNPPIKLEDVTP